MKIKKTKGRKRPAAVVGEWQVMVRICRFDPAQSAGDQRHFPGNIEQVFHHSTQAQVQPQYCHDTPLLHRLCRRIGINALDTGGVN